MSLQFDIPMLKGPARQVSSDVKGKINETSFIYIVYQDLKEEDYDVLMTTIDTTSHNGWRNLGQLKKEIFLPEIVIPNDASVMICPKKNPKLPRFISKLNRGATYIIPTRVKSGTVKIPFHGIAY